MEKNREEAPSKEKTQTKRWPGVIFSLLVPGFGLFRAGKWGRGIAWLVGLQLAGVLYAVCLASAFVPIALGYFILLGLFGLVVWMWYDSFRPGRMTGKLWLLFFLLLAVTVLLPIPARLVARPFKIPAGGTEPTLMGPGNERTPDQIVVNRLSYLFSKPERGDIIAFGTVDFSGLSRLDSRRHSTEEIYYVKRIVGLPGERIEIHDGSVFADGKKLTESDGIPPIHHVSLSPSLGGIARDGNAFLVGPGQYFVLGDNSENSADSRMWGNVPESSIYGKVTKIYYPFSRMGPPVYRAGD